MRLSVALVALALSGCAAVKLASAPEVPLGEDFDVALGKSAFIASTGFRVTFVRVSEESRCPMNARCVWEGNAKVVVLFGSLSAETLELNTSERFARSGRFMGFEVTLVHLEPTPMAGEKVKKYVATFRVEAKP
jgi:hypothetical protein